MLTQLLAPLDARQATSEEHKLHFLQQLKFLLVPDSNSDDDNQDRRDDDDRGDTASVHRTYRTRALDNSIDYQLTWQLSLELQQEHHQKPDPATITTAEECLVSLWQHASQERRQSAFYHLVKYAPSLVRALRIFPDHQQLFANTIQIFRLWARSTTDQVLLGRMLQSHGFIDFLREGLSMSSSLLYRVAPMLCLIKELSFRSSDRDNQLLHTALADVLSERLHDSLDAVANGELMETGLAILWKLSTQSLISRRMAEDAWTWSILQRVTQKEFDPISMVTHRHVASIVGCIMSSLSEATSSIAGDAPPPNRLLRQRERASEQGQWILAHVHRLFRSQERDADLRRRWMRLLRCWSSSDWGRAILLRRRAPVANDGASSTSSVEELVALLIQVLRNPDDAVDVRCQACHAVANILPTFDEKDIGSFDGIFGPCLESILIEVIRDDRTPAKLMIPLCEALSTSIANNRSWKRGPFNCATSFYERLVSALQEGVADPLVHYRISQLALNLVELHPTSQHQALHHVADLAALLVTPVGPEYERSRDNGVSIVDQLIHAQERDASAIPKKHLADNERLLSALVGYCLQHHHGGGGKKDRAKRLIIELVPEL